jgi:hypothetical protein
VTYASRDHLMDALQDTLLRQIHEEQALAISLIPDAVLLNADDGPAIDEDDYVQAHVTADPRLFPTVMRTFPIRWTPQSRGRGSLDDCPRFSSSHDGAQWQPRIR